MSDELPTEERLDRIERGVQRRIDARRATAQRVARGVGGGAVAVLLVVGGFALIRPGVNVATSGAASSAEGAAPALVQIECHDGASTTTVQAARNGLPASAVAACSRTRFSGAIGPKAQSASGAAAATPQPAPTTTDPTGVLCRTKAGALHLYLGSAAACSTHGMTPFGR